MTGVEQELVIQFRIYNIRNGNNGGLDLAFLVMDQGNIDLGFFQDTKVTD